MNAMRPVQTRYYPDNTPPELQWLNVDISNLDFGENDYTCLFRLICFWDETDVRNGHQDSCVYSQWIDMLEHCINGYTEPGETEKVKELLLPGSIYRIQNPFLISARRILRSCPSDFVLQIRPANLQDRIDEDSARPFFPLESFNIATMLAMRAIAQPRTSSLDIIGRLSGVTRPTPSPAGGLFFKLLLASGERFTVRYSRFRPLTPVVLNSIAVLERLHPVICILTVVTVTNSGEDMLIFENTPASRILFPSVAPLFLPYFDMFSHMHVPVQMLHPRREHRFEFLRGQLPDKFYLSALLRQHPAMLSFQNYQSSAWCLVRLLSFDANSPNIQPNSVHFSYLVVVRCSDATTTTNILFSGAAASFLFRMLPEEYVLLSESQENALLTGLQGAVFIVEVRLAEPTDMLRTQFIATNIWDPVAAFY